MDAARIAQATRAATREHGMTIRTASCACGQLRITCHGEPRSVSLCHCLDCQKRTGSTYGIAAFFPRGAVEAEGRATSFTRPPRTQASR